MLYLGSAGCVVCAVRTYCTRTWYFGERLCASFEKWNSEVWSSAKFCHTCKDWYALLHSLVYKSCGMMHAKERLTLLESESLVSLIYAPESKTRGLIRLCHLIDDLGGIIGPRSIVLVDLMMMMMTLLVMRSLALVDKASVAFVIGIDVAVIHGGHEVMRRAFFPSSETRELLLCNTKKRKIMLRRKVFSLNKR